MSPEQTLAHTAAIHLPHDFEAFWAETREAAMNLPGRWQGSLDGPINEIVIQSWRSVRIVGRLTVPGNNPAGAVITTHGYHAEERFPDEDEPWSAQKLLTLRLRVRGYPPSTLDVDDLRENWITRGIESPDAWILRGAVIDLIQAYRCLRHRFGAGFPIAIHGESFGGGLAVLAAAQLAQIDDPPCRLILALPSFGDWRWRRGRYCNGAGGEVNRAMEMMRQDAHRIMHSLLLFDAAAHARRITVPTLCKLALLDDTVPAPTAAAVFNAINTAAKWRFITRFGHFEGGIADARRHVMFERIHPNFAAPTRKPGDIAADQSVSFEAQDS